MTSLAVAALVLAACGGPTDATPTPSRAASDIPATTSPSASPTTTATANSDATAEPSPTAPFEDAATCRNDDLGYELDYPADWWANERIEPDAAGLSPIAACQYFATVEVDLQPNAGLPLGLAIWFRIPDGGMVVGGEDETIERAETTVDGRDALVIEFIPAPQAGFVPENSRTYLYAVELEGDRLLVASTDDILQDRDGYEDAKEVLDGMMATIEIGD